MVVTVLMAAVRAAFRLKCRLQFDERGSKTAKHVFDDVIRSNAKSLTAQLGRHMPIPEMPREPHELTWILMGDVDDGFSRRSNDEPTSILDLQSVSIAHGGRGIQLEEHFVALIGDQADTTTVPVVEGERQRIDRQLLRPFARASMNDGSLRPIVTVSRCFRSHISTRNSAVPSEASTPAHR